MMTNQPLNERYETAVKSIDVQRECASAQSYIAGSSIFAGNTSLTKAWYIWPEHHCLSFFILLPSIMLTLYVL